MMMYGSAGLLSEFQSSNPVQKRLYQCHISVVTYTCISVSSQAGAARKRQGRMTIWGSWTRRCSCTWITAAAMAMAARSCKSKGVVSVYACMHFIRRSLTTDRPKFNCSCRVFACLAVFVFAASQMQLTSSSNVLVD